MYVWAAAVALAILAGTWTASHRHAARAGLPLEHVAGATLLGFLGWEMLVELPGSVMDFWSLTAGLGDVSAVRGQQAYVVAQAAFVIGAAFAVAGILRRRPWGAILGIGLACAAVVWRGLLLVSTLQTFGGALDRDTYLGLVTTMMGLEAIPALAVVVLLARPMLRPTAPRRHGAPADWPAQQSAADRPG